MWPKASEFRINVLASGVADEQEFEEEDRGDSKSMEG